MKILWQVLLIAACASFAACATSKPNVPYPAFVQVDDTQDIFLAELPGIRTKQFAGDANSDRSSNLLLLPANYDFSTGAAPNKSIEIFVLAGEIELGDLTLRQGGYAWLPAGSTGTNIRSRAGAELLYFFNSVDDRSTIQVPLINSVDAGRWKPLSDDPEDFGLSVLELRSDPGSGARTWLLKIDSVAQQPWQSYSAAVEGYLVSGNYQHSECIAGTPVTGSYTTGGYFLRPPAAVNGGPDAASTGTSIWFLRTLGRGERTIYGACVLMPQTTPES
jgi:hypothetical protein